MSTPEKKQPNSLWLRFIAKLEPSSQNTNHDAQKPVLTTLPIMNTFDPDTCRMMEIRYTRKDNE